MNKILIVGHGPSCQEFVDNIELFKGRNCLLGSLNLYAHLEAIMLSRIQRLFDILWCSAPVRVEEMYTQLQNAAARGALIMTTHESKPLVDFPGNFYLSSYGVGFSSIFAMLCGLLFQGYRDIYLVGFDGAPQADQVYFNQEKIQDNFLMRKKTISRDTQAMNSMFWPYVEYALNIREKSCRIINLEGSAITCFPKMNIKQIAHHI